MSVQKPIILKKRSVVILKPSLTKQRIPVPDILSQPTNSKIKPLYREDVIFESNGESFLKGEYQTIVIINRLNNLTQSSRTIAKCTLLNNIQVEKSSDNITKLLGPEAYNTILYSLCSVINQEYRIRGILALLTVNNPVNSVINNVKTLKEEKACQTYEMRIPVQMNKRNRRVRRVVAPHVVQDPPTDNRRKVIVDTVSYLQRLLIKEDKKQVSKHNEPIKVDEKQKMPLENSNKDLPDLGYLQDENSSDSMRTCITLGTFKTTPEILLNPMSLVSNVDKNTQYKPMVLPNYPVVLWDKTVVRVPFKPEDNFHIATEENLQFLNSNDQKKLVLHQMKIDYKFCLTMDEDGNLPIHVAVINDDIELLKRQCIVLKTRNQSVDIPAANGLTALKLSLFRDTATATGELLSRGASPLRADEAHSACAHLAAELRTDHLAAVLHHAAAGARSIVEEHEELQSPGWEAASDEELKRRLFEHICCKLFDKRGYTPLMLASKLGHYENVRLLLEAAPCANITQPTTGHTALYLAVAAACALAAEHGNKSKIVDHYRKTIEILLESGADPSLENDYGTNVNTLLSELNCAELSRMVANKFTSTKFFNDEEQPKNFDEFALFKDKGNINIIEISNKNSKKDIKPVIVKDEILDVPIRVRKSDLGSKVVGTSRNVLDIVLNAKSKRKAEFQKDNAKMCKK